MRLVDMITGVDEVINSGKIEGNQLTALNELRDFAREIIAQFHYLNTYDDPSLPGESITCSDCGSELYYFETIPLTIFFKLRQNNGILLKQEDMYFDSIEFNNSEGIICAECQNELDETLIDEMGEEKDKEFEEDTI